MSEFYKQRRTSIKDGVGLVAFIFGWFAAAPFAWPYISAGFDNGDPAKGVLRFFFVVLAVGMASGALGLVLGTVSGWAWERVHRSRRSNTPEADEVLGQQAAPISKDDKPRIPLPALRFDAVASTEYLGLVRRQTTEVYDPVLAAQAFEKSINIGAWNGERLVGAVRLMSDGYLFAALADIIVDEEYQRRGLGRQLMNLAFDRTPRGILQVTARQGSGAFFDHIGCDRSVSGFVMRRPAKTLSS